MNRSDIRSLIAVGMLAGLCACAAPLPPAPTVALPPAPVAGEPQGIAGLDAGQVRVAFGAPAFVRQDGTSQLWRYDGASCKAFFFLYPNGNSLAVRHVETQPRGQDMAADATCLNTLRTPHAPAPVS